MIGGFARSKRQALDTAPQPAGGARLSVDGELVYAVGDVHGCYALLKTLLGRIAIDIRTRQQGRRPVLIFCGDYVDRGPDAAQVLASLIWLRRHGAFELHLLKGNHEAMLLDYLDDPVRARGWLSVGGAETLQSYGIEAPSRTDEPTLHWQAREDLLERMPASHLRLLQSLELSVQIGDYAFVHAGVRPGISLEEQSEQDILWIRKGFIDRDEVYEKMIVHGHSWNSDQPVVLPHRIGIDTGAYKTGVLTALRLEDGEMSFLQVGAG